VRSRPGARLPQRPSRNSVCPARAPGALGGFQAEDVSRASPEPEPGTRPPRHGLDCKADPNGGRADPRYYNKNVNLKMARYAHIVGIPSTDSDDP